MKKYQSFFTSKIHEQKQKKCEFKYLLNATLNFNLLFLTLVRLSGKLLELFMPV
jgi:hypothetical protein